MSLTTRAGVSNDGYIQVNGTDRIGLDSNGNLTFLNNMTLSSDVIIGGTLKVKSSTLNTNSTVTVGPTASTSTATPTLVDLGGTYSSVGGQNMKLKLYTDPPTNISYGIGVSISGSMDYIAPNTASHNFYTNGSNRLSIDGNGYISRPAQPYFFGYLNNGTAAGAQSIVTEVIYGGIQNLGSYLTVPKAGVYMILFQQLVQTVSTALYYSVYVNGAQIRYAYEYNYFRDMAERIVYPVTAGGTIQFVLDSAVNNTWPSPYSTVSVYLLG